MTDREELLMVQVVKLQYELSQAEYAVKRWRKSATWLYNYFLVGDFDDDNGERIMKYFRETEEWDHERESA